MLQFKQDDTAAAMILTLTELVTINDPHFIFEFTHVLNKAVVTLVKQSSDDESDFTDRYNQFTIDASDVFEDQPVGEWHYKVFESADGTTKGTLLEEGKLLLDRAVDIEYKKYESPTSYKAYNG